MKAFHSSGRKLTGTEWDVLQFHRTILYSLNRDKVNINDQRKCDPTNNDLLFIKLTDVLNCPNRLKEDCCCNSKQEYVWQ